MTAIEAMKKEQKRIVEVMREMEDENGEPRQYERAKYAHLEKTCAAFARAIWWMRDNTQKTEVIK